jgi:hypothetical protein
VGHKKSRNGCAQCKRRHVKVSDESVLLCEEHVALGADKNAAKCNEVSPCSNCNRHGVACSLAGGPIVYVSAQSATIEPVLTTTQRKRGCQIEEEVDCIFISHERFKNDISRCFRSTVHCAQSSSKSSRCAESVYCAYRFHRSTFARAAMRLAVGFATDASLVRPEIDLRSGIPD